MIILRKKINLRSKTFAKTSEMPEPFPIPDEWDGKYTIVKNRVNVSDRVKKERSQYTGDEAKLIKKYISDLAEGYVYSDHPDRPNGKTEYLEEFSKPYKKNRPFHRLTKRINIFDRFDYVVYPPELDEEKKEVYYPIIVQSLKDHNIAGQKKYSETD